MNDLLMQIVVVAVVSFAVALAAAWVCDALETDFREDSLLLPHVLSVLFGKGVQKRHPGVWPALFLAVAGAFCAIAAPGNTLATIVLCSLAAAASVIDLRLNIIPEELTWGALFAGLFLSPWASDLNEAVAGAAIGCAAIWAALAFVGYVKKEDTRAGGDVASGAVAGAWVGMHEAGHLFMAMAVLYAAHSAIEAFKGKRWVPMGPSIFAAIPLTMIFTGPMSSIFDNLL